MKKKTTALELASQLGQNLLQSALKNREEEFKKKAVKEIAIILEQTEYCKRTIMKEEKRLEFCEKRLKAINKGEFEIIEYHQTVYSPRIKYNDPELNIGWDATEAW